MTTVAQQLRKTIDTAKPKLLSIPDGEASAKPFPDKWSIKEILGHLIDSAANNHQRIVRMQEAANIGSFTYTQQHWVTSQQYINERWNDIVALWYAYNAHLSHIISQVDPGCLGNKCDMGYSEPATLRFVIEDYARHVRHHLDQIFSDVDPRKREVWIRRSPSQNR